MVQVPLKTEISDTYPNPSNAVARVGFARLYDWIMHNLGMWVAAGGSANAITAMYSPAITALQNGQCLKFRALYANTNTTPTFSPNGLTALPITQYGGLPLAAGSIGGPGHEVIVRFNLTEQRWELMNPAIDANAYPLKNGTGATGTWGINTTGNAATASLASAIVDGAVSAAAKIANNIIGLNKLARTGVSGQALLSGGPGADPYWGTLDTGGGVTQVKFTASGTWTKPVGCKSILVECIGGGGGGQGVSSSGGLVIPDIYSIGGQGYYSRKYFDVTGVTDAAVTIGGGGSPGCSYTNWTMSAASGGGATSVNVNGSTVTARGGEAGSGHNAGTDTWAYGAAASGSNTGTFSAVLSIVGHGNPGTVVGSSGSVCGGYGGSGAVLITEFY